MKPGDWTATGWGVRHRIRVSDAAWTELVCHLAGQRVPTERIDAAAGETENCSRCSALPDLGPLRYAPLGEVRQAEDGATVVCVSERPTATRWHLVGDDTVEGTYGWRDEWAVARWQVRGNVADLVPPPALRTVAAEVIVGQTDLLAELRSVA